MPLDRDQLTAIAVEGFFGSLNRHDLAGSLAVWADDCAMRVPGSGFAYEGKEALAVHLDDFLKVFRTVRFSDFTVTADEVAQRVAVRFRVSLTDHAGEEDVMWNANFFDIDADGLIGQTIIYTSQPVKKGFEKGSV